MKIQSSLKELRQKKPSKPPAKKDADGAVAKKPWADPNNRPRDMLAHLRKSRILSPDLVFGWRLTDDEMRQVMVDNQHQLVDAWGIETGPHAYESTPRELGGSLSHHGWSIVPQDRTGERKPAKIPDSSGKRTQYHPFYPSRWRERRVPLREIVQWIEMHNANLAVQCCAASAHARAIDIDCLTPGVAEHVMQLAFEHLGTTPFVRVGMAPKLLLLYRVEGEDIDISSFSVTLGNVDGTVDIGDDGQPLNAIEFLANGKIVTCYGLHHKTGRPFDWTRGTMHPAAAGPENAPVINKDSLAAFFNAVHAYRPFLSRGSSSNPYGGKASFEAFEARDVSGQRMWTPTLAKGQWTTDSNGKVTGSGEKWLSDHVWAYCAANPALINEQGLERIAESLTALAKEKLLGVHRENASIASEASIERTVRTKLKASAKKWKASLEAHAKTGQYHAGIVPYSIAKDGRRAVSQRVPTERPADGSLDWLPTDTCPVPELARTKVKTKTVMRKLTAEQIADNRIARALINSREQRKATATGVSEGVKAHIDDWLMQSVSEYLQEYEATGGSARPQSPWVLRAPTGAGKTVSIISKLAEFCRIHPRRPGQGPILLVLPTHANADEAMATAARAGMIVPDMTEQEIDELIAAGAKIGVKIVRFRGREASGCQRSEEMRLLGDKGIRASGLCEARVEVGDKVDVKRARRDGEKVEYETVLCPFRERGECQYYRQFDDLRDADVVIVAQAYLTLNSLPKELKNPRAVIIDESTTYALLQQTRFPISTLNAARQRPYVTKTDRKLNPDASDEQIADAMVQDREELAALTVKWLTGGADVAAELMKHDRCDQLLMSAIAVCDRSHTLDRQVRPTLSREEVRDLSERPVGRGLISEVRFWKTVQDRIRLVREGTAKGERDMRWQCVQDFETIESEDGDKSIECTPHLRLSWRRGPNWAGVPMLLLDASANPRIIEKTYGAKPEIREVSATLHVRTVAMIERTWSNSSFIVRPDSTDEEIKKIAETIADARKLITTTAVLYGHGRVLVGTTISVREVLTGGGWTPPPNVDFVHFGALRGLDFGKGHVAAISIGRSEQPISVIDGYVGALTYDDADPELPVDINGNGITPEGKVLFRPRDWQTIQMRNGIDVDHEVPGMGPRIIKGEDGKPVEVRSWAQDLEESWREEEIRQFVGRLRPVYRGVDDDLPPPLWLAVGKILPQGIVVDELVEMESITSISPMAELVRLGGGVLADNVTGRLPGAAEIMQGRDLTTLSNVVLPNDPHFRQRFVAAFKHIVYEVPSQPGMKKIAMILPAWIDGDPCDAWLQLSERYGELPSSISETPARLVAPASKAKPADKRDISRDDQFALESEINRLHGIYDAEMPKAEFEIRLGRGDYLPKLAVEAEMA